MELPEIRPMVLARAKEAFDHPEWLFEPKLDGFRALAYVEGGECRLVSRKKHAYKSFPLLCASIAVGLKVESAILDGEIVCIGTDGHPIFSELLYHRSKPYLYAFDLLWLNGKDLRKLPLVARKRRLRRMIPPEPFPVMYTDHEIGNGVDLYQAACSLDLEGIVAKWKYGPYVGDEVATSWVKITNPTYSQSKGRHEQFTRFRHLSLSQHPSDAILANSTMAKI
jgi:bifunctional non-homologous end joining protein LigD